MATPNSTTFSIPSTTANSTASLSHNNHLNTNYIPTVLPPNTSVIPSTKPMGFTSTTTTTTTTRNGQTVGSTTHQSSVPMVGTSIPIPGCTTTTTYPHTSTFPQTSAYSTFPSGYAAPMAFAPVLASPRPAAAVYDPMYRAMPYAHYTPQFTAPPVPMFAQHHLPVPGTVKVVQTVQSNPPPTTDTSNKTMKAKINGKLHKLKYALGPNKSPRKNKNTRTTTKTEQTTTTTSDATTTVTTTTCSSTDNPVTTTVKEVKEVRKLPAPISYSFESLPTTIPSSEYLRSTPSPRLDDNSPRAPDRVLTLDREAVFGSGSNQQLASNVELPPIDPSIPPPLLPRDTNLDESHRLNNLDQRVSDIVTTHIVDSDESSSDEESIDQQPSTQELLVQTRQEISKTEQLVNERLEPTPRGSPRRIVANYEVTEKLDTTRDGKIAIQTIRTSMSTSG